MVGDTETFFSVKLLQNMLLLANESKLYIYTLFFYKNQVYNFA